MKRIAAATLALALTAASGSVFASHDDYGYDRDDDGRESYSSDDSNSNYNNGPHYAVARVLSVDPIVQPGRQVADRQCWNEPQRGYSREGGYRDGYYRDDRYRHHSGPSGGTVLGAVIGGALGNMAGKGDGRHAATIAGAVIGGAIGHSVAKDNDYRNGRRVRGQYGYDNGYYGNTQQCRQVGNYDQDERVIGYHVAFEYNGQVYHTTTSHVAAS